MRGISIITRTHTRQNRKQLKLVEDLDYDDDDQGLHAIQTLKRTDWQRQGGVVFAIKMMEVPFLPCPAGSMDTYADRGHDIIKIIMP